ncbi:guanine nucleotide-binding protein subunit alpha [Marasmius oreades]|uniref:Guanine nucleotide-binding protein subunit alpha n=1 Tax=Marasmius oreades TaxID=181124 RepID=A0A9P7RXG8_9AGAR|nr:guanine nucleotide-binding protein subunit alpha [Marasmius oreades]KAG7091614.1 guanine nucleotide-binding protein subunit alpha [Marasmius oreades]
MGNCVSQQGREDKERSDAIDKQIEDDAKRFKRECKILLLGSGESGKSTVVKQMRIIHKDGFPDSERATYAPIVYRNVLDSAQAIIVMMRKLNIDCETYSNRPLADKIVDYKLDESTAFVLSPDIAEAIHQFRKDPVVNKIIDEHGSEFYLMDSADYFFTEVLRIGSPDYLPNETDVLRARQKSTGITETRFSMGQLSIHMFDVGGQRSERRKWIHCFESVTSIIFCTALSEYDQVLLEEKSQNRMTESLVLFESIINSRWFLRTSIILFLNKIDVFKKKLPKVPLERYFSEYTGGNDINKAAKYILWKFMQANRARLSVYPHLTQATDTTNIRLVFAAVKETILQNALKASGIL